MKDFIKNADLILVMNEGNIIEQGNHNELSFCVGGAPIEFVNEYGKMYIENKEVK